MSKYIYSYDGGKLWSPYNYCGFYEKGRRELLVKDEKGVISLPFVSDTNNACYRDLGVILPKEIKTNQENYDGVCWTNKDIEVTLGSADINDIQFDWYEATSLEGTWTKINTDKIVYPSTTTDSKVYLKIIDEFGNESQPFVLQLRQDILNPVNVDCLVTHTMTIINIEAKGTDSVCGILGYDCSIDGGDNFTEVQPGRFFRFRGLTPGNTYPIIVRVHDKAGNITTSQIKNITLL